MHTLIEQMKERIASGLQRKSVSSPSRWAEKYRMMGAPTPGLWNFKYHPWLKEMHDSKYEINVGQKSAQMGYTETVLNLTFYNIDVKGVDCLYVLPAKTPDASDFSSGRFNQALELSPHLANLFSDVKNVGHKRAGSANLYIRGSKSRGGLKSVPVGFIVLDELEEMDQDNISLALERASGQMEWSAWMISTPTLPEVGINKRFIRSTQDIFNFKCPGCSRWTNLVFPDCMVITAEDEADPKVNNSYYRCKECQVKLEHETKWEWLKDAKWIPTFSDRDERGFHISQMYSSARAGRAGNLAKLYLSGLKDPADATEFNNSKLGLTYIASGAQLNDEEINARIAAYGNGKMRPSGLITMGVDVGKFLHVEIDEWTLGDISGVDINSGARCRVLSMEKVVNFNDLDKLMSQWGVHACVIDANPERRAALEFANRFFGFVHTCTYAQGISGKNIHVSKDEEQAINVDRTSWMDLALSRFRRDEMIYIPRDTPFEYKTQLKVPIRTYKKDRNGQKIGYYDSRDKDDHYAHARVYAELALNFAAALGQNRNIRSPV